MKKIHIMLVVLFAFAVVTCTSGVASALYPKYVGNTMVDLSWTQYESTDFSKYELYRDGSLIETIRARTVTFYRDTGLTKGQTYNYEIRSYYTTDKYRSDTTSATTGEVHGTITRDTTWTAASSPYTLTEWDIRVRNGATLTIERGITVIISSYLCVQENGALYADGVSFSGGDALYGPAISITNAHASIKNCFFEEGRISLYNSSYSDIMDNSGFNEISLERCSSHNNIIGNNIMSNIFSAGIGLDTSNNNTIKGNSISNHNILDYGSVIGLYLSNDNRFSDNTLSNNNNSGIFLKNSSNNTFKGNTLSNNSHFKISLMYQSNNNVIKDNKVLNNTNFYDETSLVDLAFSSNNTFKGNIISNNDYCGINYYSVICIGDSSNNNTFKGNTVTNNNSSYFALLLVDSSNNKIYNNYFNNIDNAYDDGNNIWNITKTPGTNIVGGPYLGGNYWSDYEGEDLDGDKLGDTLLPYTSSWGIQNGGDYHPLIIIPKIILKASKDGYASVQHEVDNDENFERIEISGIVFDKKTGELIEGAKVELIKGANHAVTTTNVYGNYSITAIIPDGSGSDTREDVHFELPPAEFIVGVYEITSEVLDLIENNNGTVIDQTLNEDWPQALLVNIFKEEDIEPFINNVNKSDLVQYVELNDIIKATYIPNDYRYLEQWGPQNIWAAGPPDPSAWDVERGNRSVRIAIIDTGIQFDHRDLHRFNDGTIKYVYGYDYVDIDNDPSPVAPQEDHGTHCAGVATAVMDNYEGIAGIAPNCSLIAERVLGMVFIPVPLPGHWEDRGDEWSIGFGIMDAANHDADVISMSLGGPGPHWFERFACRYASNQGSILVAAAGNDADKIWYRGGIDFPAAYPWVIAVGATDRNDGRATFFDLMGNIWGASQWGPELELVAPGVDILSTVFRDGYTTMSGTSMATPHVAGVAALVKSRAERWPPEPLVPNPRYHLNNSQIRQVLIQSATDLGPSGWDRDYGWGKVDAARAIRCVNISGNVREALNNASIPHPPDVPSLPMVNVTSIEGPPGNFTTNENTPLARITKDGDYHVRVPPGVYSICAMAYGYIPSRGLGGERVELPAFDLGGQLNEEHMNFSLDPFRCNVTGIVNDSQTGLLINNSSISLDGPPLITPPYSDVHLTTKTDSNGTYSLLLEYSVHPPYPTGEAVYNITVRKSGYKTQTRNFTLNWSAVVTDYYKCPLDPNDFNPPIVNFSLLSGPLYLPDLNLTNEDITFSNDVPVVGEQITINATIHNDGTVDANGVVVQFFDGNPDASGVQIESDQTISDIAHESTGTAQMTWTVIPGTHDIFVLVDPYNTIQEAKEDNNQAYKQITISGAKTIYVDDDFTDDPACHRWDTIQEGITDANVGDTVLVYTGTYTETVVLNKRLTLTGDGMPEINAQSLGDAITITTDNCTVKGFNCVNAQPSPYAGIRVDSSNNLIEDNTCKDNYIGIYLLDSSNEIRNNIAKNNQHYGIRLQASDDNIIKDNTAKGNGASGIHLKASDYNRIMDNDASNSVNYHGISVSSSNNNEVRNNVANSNHQVGIGLWSSCDNIIAKNTAKSNGNHGIYLQESNDNRITDNEVSNNVKYHGISLKLSNNNDIRDNTANTNGNDGIYLNLSHDNKIIGNDASNNVNYHGISLKSSSKNEVRNNVADSNHYDGIKLRNSTDNIILNNTVKNNEDDGISLTNSNNNRIYMNNFMDNDNNVNSEDSTNIWHSPSELDYIFKGNTHTNYLGNYWGDYTGSDTDNDGIGNSHYIINSDKDIYPLKEPLENYFVAPETDFDTGEPANQYPSIMGTHTGTIKPNQPITISKLYTYSCPGTGGHTEYILIHGNGVDTSATWNGYQSTSDYHLIEFSAPVTLEEGVTYDYTIRTGSYPQMHHTSAVQTATGWLNCTAFEDKNGKVYYDRIPAVKFF